MKVSNPLFGSEGHTHILLAAWHAILQGTWTITHVAGDYLGLVSNTSGAINDRLRYSMWLAKGTYYPVMVYNEGNRNGICQISIDGVNVFSQDMYAVGGAANLRVRGGAFTLNHNKVCLVEIVTTSKNGASSAYWLELQALAFYQV